MPGATAAGTNAPGRRQPVTMMINYFAAIEERYYVEGWLPEGGEGMV